MFRMKMVLKQIGTVSMSLKGSRSFGLSFSPSDLSWVFFEGHRSVEDKLKGEECTALYFSSHMSFRT